MRACERASDLTLLALATHCSHLHTLDLGGLPLITSLGLTPLLTRRSGRSGGILYKHSFTACHVLVMTGTNVAH